MSNAHTELLHTKDVDTNSPLRARNLDPLLTAPCPLVVRAASARNVQRGPDERRSLPSKVASRRVCRAIARELEAKGTQTLRPLDTE